MKIARCIEVSGFIVPVPAPGLQEEVLYQGSQEGEICSWRTKIWVPWPGPDDGAGQSHPHPPPRQTHPPSCCRASTATAVHTQPQPRAPEEIQGAFKGEGGEHNTKDLPRASVSLCQVQADGHTHYTPQATQSMTGTQHSGRKKPSVPRMKGPAQQEGAR